MKERTKDKKGMKPRRIVSIMISALLIISMLPVSAFAQELELEPESAGEQQFDAEDELSLSAEETDEQFVDSENQTDIDLSDEADAGIMDELSDEEMNTATVLSNKEMKDLTQTVIKSAATGNPSKVAEWALDWGTGKVVNAIFGSLGEKKETSLADILFAIERLQFSIDTLQRTTDSEQFDKVLNDLKPLLNDKTTFRAYSTLKNIDKQYTGEKAKLQAQSVVIDGIGNGYTDNARSMANTSQSFDKFTDLLWDAVMGEYNFTISGKTKQCDLMQIWYEHLRYKYFWEHQAHSEWVDFQTRTLNLLVTTLELERASLLARIELIEKMQDENGLPTSEDCKTLLAETQEKINYLVGYKGKDAGGDDVEYEGAFSEKAWAEKYWMYKERPDYRYYWKPGDEILFYAYVNNQGLPNEKKGAKLRNNFKDGRGNCAGLSVDWFGGIWVPHVITSYWEEKGFLSYRRSYNGEGHMGKLISGDKLEDIYDAYGSDKHLYDIFIGKDEGNFLGLDETGINSWWFIVEPKGKYSPYAKITSATTAQARCYALKSGTAKKDWVRLHSYSMSDSWMNHSKHYIGLGVARYGAETYGSGAVVPPQEETPVNTSTKSEYAMWWPGCDDVGFGYETKIHGNLVKATMDDKDLDDSMYMQSENRVIVYKDFMEGLAFGPHKLVLTTEHGTHTVTFAKKDKQVIEAKNVKKTFGDKKFALKVKAKGGCKFTFASSDEKVAKINKNGEVSIKGAGKAKITIVAEETKDYGPAEKTITITVGKSKQKVSVVTETKKVNYNQLKEKKKTVKPIKKVTKKGGKVSYEILSGPSGFKIDKKTGKITIRKRTARGTYKIKIRVTSAANKNYKEAHKDVTATIVIND